MQKYNDTKYLSINSFQKDIDLYIDKLKNKELKKIIIKNVIRFWGDIVSD